MIRKLPILLALVLLASGCGGGGAEPTDAEPAATTTQAAAATTEAAPSTTAATPTTTGSMDDDEHMDDDDGHMDDDDHGDFHFGAPADAADADRVIEITGGDDLKFDPAQVTIKVGEIITFRVYNPGVLPHDFTLGDEHVQDEHEAEMAEMGGSMDHMDANAVLVPPGETVELTWEFTEAGTILMGCHQPGHYAAGMKGTIVIEA